jgi:hypothetical protein
VNTLDHLVKEVEKKVQTYDSKKKGDESEYDGGK